MNTYQIFIVNQMTSEQEFFCFLSQPDVDGTSATIYANSSTYVSVVPNSPALNFFSVPVQYVLAASNSNQAVGLNIRVDTLVTTNVNLGDQWEASFADPFKHQAGALVQTGSAAPTRSLQLQTNSYPQGNEFQAEWFANETFGIQTQSGFIGVTWAPSAGTTTTIVPQLQFYIATGDYAANQLADMTTVSTTSQLVTLGDFDQYLNCTVTRTSNGGWSIAQGKPQAVLAA